MTAVPGVVVKWRTPGLIVASVRDGLAGVADVRWTQSVGFSCSCGKQGCVHAAAVRRLVEATAK